MTLVLNNQEVERLLPIEVAMTCKSRPIATWSRRGDLARPARHAYPVARFGEERL